MDVTVRGKLDINSMKDGSFLAFSLFVTEATKVFFGKPESAAKLEEWRAHKQKEEYCGNDYV